MMSCFNCSAVSAPYVLMHRNTEVALLQFAKDTGAVEKILSFYKREELPIGVKPDLVAE